MFTNVVWATDGSGHADRALGYAARIARSNGATLHVVHVVEKMVGVRVAGQNANYDESEVDAKIERQVREIAAEYEIPVTLHMTTGRTGDVAQRIVETARQTGGDLIVTGTRGYSAVVGAMIGSVTQRLLHVAHCPVLAVPPLEMAGEPAPPARALTTA